MKTISVRIPEEAHRALLDLQTTDGISPATRVRAWVLSGVGPTYIQHFRREIDRESKSSRSLPGVPNPNASTKRRKKR